VLRRIATAAIVTAVVLGLAAACIIHGRNAPAPEREHLTLIPRNSWAFTSLRAADAWAALEKNDAVDSTRDLGFEYRVRQASGLPPDMVERISWVMLEEGQAQPIVIVTGTDGLDEAEIVERLAPAAELRKREDAVYYFAPTSSTAVHFVNRRTFAIGEEALLADWLEKTRQPMDPGPMDDALDRARGDGDHLVAAFTMTDVLRVLSGLYHPKARMLLNFQRATLTASTGRVMTFEFEAVYEDKFMAARGVATAQEAKLRMQSAAGKWSKPQENPGLVPFCNALTAGIESLQFMQHGQTVRITGQTEPVCLNPLIKNISMLPVMLEHPEGPVATSGGLGR
jgi:hypothetical protein